MLSAFTWSNTSTRSNISTDIVNYYFTQTATSPLGKKYANLRYVRGKFKIIVMVQGCAFAQGCAVVSFDPNPIDNVVNQAPVYISAPQKCRMTQIPHLKLDPSKSCRYEIELDCPNQVGLYSPTSNPGSYSVDFIPLCTMGSGTSTAATANVMVYGMFVDPEWSVLTYTSSMASKEQKPSDFVGYITSASNFVASMNIPGISTGATLFSNISSATSDFLRWMGFSKQRILSNPLSLVSTVPPLTTLDSNMAGTSLALYETNSLSLNPESVPGGGSLEDQTFSYLLNKFAFLGQFQIPTSTTADSLVISYPVHPAYCYITDSPAVSNGFEMSPMCFLQSMYDYWRGDIEYEIEVICSVFHRAMICVAYAPNPQDYNLSYANANQTLKCWHMQISGNTSLKVTIPWSTVYPVLSTFKPTGFNISAVTGPYSNNNGAILIYLCNPIITNGSTDGIWINIYGRCPNMKLAVPTLNKALTTSIVLTKTSDNLSPPINQVINSADDPEFYTRLFGEPTPASVKDLASRLCTTLTTLDVSTRTTAGWLNWYILNSIPTSTYNVCLSTSTTVFATNGLTYQQGFFSYIAMAYVGWRGSVNTVWYPDDMQWVSNTLDNLPTYSTPTVTYAPSGYALIGSYLSSDAVSANAGGAFTSGFSYLQNNLSFTAPHYTPTMFRLTYPGESVLSGHTGAYGNTAATGLISLNVYAVHPVSTHAIFGSIKQGLGDDGTFVRYRGLPVTTTT